MDGNNDGGAALRAIATDAECIIQGYPAAAAQYRGAIDQVEFCRLNNADAKTLLEAHRHLGVCQASCDRHLRASTGLALRVVESMPDVAKRLRLIRPWITRPWQDDPAFKLESAFAELTDIQVEALHREKLPQPAAVAIAAASASVGLNANGPAKVDPPQSAGKPSDSDQKRLHPNDVDFKLVQALIEHHDYEDGICERFDPIEQKALHEATGVPKATISTRFAKWFGGQAKYEALCASKKIGQKLLRLLNDASSWNGSDKLPD